MVSIAEQRTSAGSFRIRRAQSGDTCGIRDLVCQGLLKFIEAQETAHQHQGNRHSDRHAARKTPSFVLDFLTQESNLNARGMVTLVAEQITTDEDALSYARLPPPPPNQDDLQSRRSQTNTNSALLWRRLSREKALVAAAAARCLQSTSSPASSESTMDSLEWHRSADISPVSCATTFRRESDSSSACVGETSQDEPPLSACQAKMRLWLEQASRSLKEKIVNKSGSQSDRGYSRPPSALMARDPLGYDGDYDEPSDDEALVNVEINNYETDGKCFDERDGGTVASDGRSIAGCVVLAGAVRPKEVQTTLTEDVEIRMLAVSQPRAGCATALIGAAETFSRRNGARRVHVLVPRESKSAQLFYLRRGFTRNRDRDVIHAGLKAFTRSL